MAALCSSSPGRARSLRLALASILATVFVLVAPAPALHAQTPAVGAIISDTTWGPAGSPYVLNGDVTVNAG